MCNIDIYTDYDKFYKIFLNENSKLNLVSKNDEKFLYEKHFYDSLAIKLFFTEYDFIPQKVLDIGTGGGFPAIPIAMEYPGISVCGIDSIAKKIKAVERMSESLELNNLTLINDRVENLRDVQYELIVSRAVGKISKLVEYAYPLLGDGGYIVLYKSLNYNNELDEAKNIIRKYHLKINPVIEYKLPLDEEHKRVLVVLEK